MMLIPGGDVYVSASDIDELLHYRNLKSRADWQLCQME